VTSFLSRGRADEKEAGSIKEDGRRKDGTRGSVIAPTTLSLSSTSVVTETFIASPRTNEWEVYHLDRVRGIRQNNIAARRAKYEESPSPPHPTASDDRRI
jgi:hypothetical protein